MENIFLEKQISFQISCFVMETSFQYIYNFLAILFRKTRSFMCIEQITAQTLWDVLKSAMYAK